MDFMALAGTIIRRWLVAVPVLLLTVVAAGMAYSRIEHTYQAEGEVMLASPTAAINEVAQAVEAGPGGESEESRPTLMSARVVAELLSGGAVRDRLRERGATASWQLEIDDEASVIRVTANSGEPAAVVPTVEEVLRIIPEVVAERQERMGLPEHLQVRVDTLATPTSPEQGGEGAGFVARGSVLLVQPGAATTGDSAYGASRFTAQVLERVMRSAQAREKVAALGARAHYEIKIDRRDTAHIFYITTIGTVPADTVQSFGSVVTVLENELFARQEASGLEPGSTARIDPLSVPTTVRDISDNQLRGIVVILGLGVAAAFSLALLAEGVLLRRRRPPPGRRSSQPARRSSQPARRSSQPARRSSQSDEESRILESMYGLVPSAPDLPDRS